MKDEEISDATHEDISAFLGEQDDLCAAVAFQRLEKNTRRLLDTYLYNHCRVSELQTRADIVQEALVKLWNARTRLKNQGQKPWRALLRQIALRCFLDWKKQDASLSFSGWDEDQIPECERPFVEALIGASVAEQIFQLADYLFLDLDCSIPYHEQERQLLAAQLFYIDGVPWQEVLSLLGPPPPGQMAIDRVVLDQWLTDPAVLNLLAFRIVFYNNLKLFQFLTSDCGQSWTDAEMQVIAWRYQYGMLEDKIEQRRDCPLKKEEINHLSERCRSLFPFSDCMESFLKVLSPELKSRMQSDFQRPGIWQRLAFEYRYREELAHRDIQDRTRPVATTVGADITEGMLNVWLSNGRLLTRLARFASTRWIDQEDRE